MENLILIYLAITIFILSYLILPTLLEAPELGSTWRRDQKFIPALENLSKFIPADEWIVSSNFNPAVQYFTGREIDVPNNISSASDLLNYMNKNDLLYVLIIDRLDNASIQENSFDRLSNFTSNFNEIATFNTDSNLLYLYRRT
jgi:hypothetical protein